MPSYFHSTIQSARRARACSNSRAAVERMREEERIGLARRRPCSPALSGAISAHVARGARLRRCCRCSPSGAARRSLASMPATAASARCTSSLRHADAKAAADQLGQQEAARRSRARPSSRAARSRLPSGGAAQRQQALLDPLARGPRSRCARGRRQHVGDGLGEVADRLVALLEQPVGDAARARSASCAQQRGRHHLARLAAGEEVRPPRRRPRGAALREVALQRLDLGVRRRCSRRARR